MRYFQQILFTYLVLISYIHFGQGTQMDTTFLLKENNNGIYHSVFIDSNKSSIYYNEISNFGFDKNDSLSYQISLDYFRQWDIQLTKTRIDSIPLQWITLKFLNGNYYSYRPSDFLANYKVSLTDSAYIEYLGEGPVAYKIFKFEKLDSSTYKFLLQGIYDGARQLTIHIIDRKNGVAIFEESQSGTYIDYYLMISKETLRNFPIIVNFCEEQKQIEFSFDKPDYKELLKLEK